MKNTIILLFICILALPSFGQSKENIEAESSIEAVTVFLQGAQITRSAKVRLQKGRNHIYFRQLANDINPASIQVKAPAPVLINSVTLQQNFEVKPAASKREVELRDSLKTLDKAIKLVQDEKVLIQSEKEMLLLNKKVYDPQTGINLAQLQQSVQFFEKRIQALHREILEQERELKELNKMKDRVNRQYNLIRSNNSRGQYEIEVVLDSDGSRTVELNLKYLANQAGWNPRYDLRADAVGDSIQLVYQANVFQTTGVNWENIPLKLSTGNPNLSGNLPVLEREYVGFVQPRAAEAAYRQRKREQETVMEEAEEMDDDRLSDATAEKVASAQSIQLTSKSMANYTTVQEGETMVSFNIALKQTLPSESRRKQVTIREEMLPANYNYFTVPKLDETAFLLAEVTQWNKLNLLSGPVAVFFEGTYVAESFLDAVSTQDTLQFSLGRDQRVVIEHEKVRCFTEDKGLGSKIVKIYEYEIRLRNSKKEAISITVKDQVPVAQDDDIDIDVEEISGAERDEKTGLLEWQLDLAPGETKTLKLVYEVTWPKKQAIVGLQ